MGIQLQQVAPASKKTSLAPPANGQEPDVRSLRSLPSTGEVALRFLSKRCGLPSVPLSLSLQPSRLHA